MYDVMYLCVMTFTKDQFCHAVNHCNANTVDEIDAQLGCCHWVRHWVVGMDRGKWNPMLNEMDYELRGIKTPQQLYDFIENKTVRVG